MAVVFQQMIDPILAGTCFSLNPSTRENGLYLELASQGRDVVDGLSRPKITIFLRETSGKLEGADWPLLAAEQVQALTRQATTVHRLARREFAWPHIDAELAVERSSGQTYFLQVRPYLLSSVCQKWQLAAVLPDIYAGGLPIVGRPAIGKLVVGHAATYQEQEALKARLKFGDILVTDKFHANWSDSVHLLSGLVTEMGGLTSHAANVANQAGLPCLVGASDAIEKLAPYEGKTVTMNTGEAALYLGRGDLVETRAVGIKETTANIANARFDFEQDGIKYFGKPRFPMTGFQLEVYAGAMEGMNRLIQQYFQAGPIPYRRVNNGELGEVIYAPCNELNRLADVIEQAPLQNVQAWLVRRQRETREFFALSQNFDFTQRNLNRLFTSYQRAVAHFHLRGTVLHGLESKGQRLLANKQLTAETFKAFQNYLFGRTSLIETKKYHNDYLSLAAEARQLPLFAGGRPLEEVISAVADLPLGRKIREFSRHYQVVNTEDIRLDPQVPLAEVVKRLIADAGREIESQPSLNYLSPAELEAVMAKFGSSGSAREFLAFTKLIYELNFENEFEHHGQPRAQWAIAERFQARRPDLGKTLWELSRSAVIRALSRRG